MSEENIIIIAMATAPLLCFVLIVVFMRLAGKIRDKSIRLLTGNFLFLMFFLSSSLLSLEIYYRYVFDSTDSIILTKVSRKWYRNNYRANRSGFRDNIEYERTKLPDKRITFIGDSFTVGQGVLLEDRFVNIVRMELSRHEVYAIAIPGWDTKTEFDVF